VFAGQVVEAGVVSFWKFPAQSQSDNHETRDGTQGQRAACPPADNDQLRWNSSGVTIANHVHGPRSGLVRYWRKVPAARSSLVSVYLFNGARSLLGSASRACVCVHAKTRVRVHLSHSNSTFVTAAPASMHICCRFSLTAPMMNLYVRPPSCSFQAGSLHNCFMSHLDLSINCNHKHRPALRASLQNKQFRFGKQSLG
jgi:hypothetical protein